MKLNKIFYTILLSLIGFPTFGAYNVQQIEKGARAVARAAVWAVLVSSAKITEFNDHPEDFLNTSAEPTVKHFVKKPNKPLFNSKQNAKRHKRAHIKRTIQQPK